MNGYERIVASLKGEIPDQRPIMLHSFMTAANEAGYTMKQYREDPEIAAKCHIQFVEKYKLDGVLFDVDTAVIAGAAGVPVDFPDNEPARTHRPLLHQLEDLGLLGEIDISKNIRIQHSIETIRILKKYFKNEIFVRGNCDQAPFSLACSIRTPAEFMMDLIMNEEDSIQLLEYSTRICSQFISLMAKAGSDMVSNGDSPAGPSMISPDMYEQFAMPYEQKMSDVAHQNGVPYLLHICGNTDVILEKMATLNIDAVDLDYKTPIQNIHALMGNKICLFGNIDPSGVMALGTPEMVTQKTRQLLEIYQNNPRLVINAGCALPPMTPEQNIRAMIDAVRNF